MSSAETISVFQQFLTPNSVSFAYHPKLENKYIQVVILRYFPVFLLYLSITFATVECFPLLGNLFFLFRSSSVVTVLQESCVLVHLHLAVQVTGLSLCVTRKH